VTYDAADPCPRRFTGLTGFTVTELLTVVGLIALIVSLLLPVVAKARAAAHTATCLSNLRQMGTALILYTAENRGRVIDYIWYTPDTPDVAWNGYWPGVVNHYGVHDNAILCPAAAEPSTSEVNRGYGNVAFAWTGKYGVDGTVVRLNDTTYRESSYGYNRYLTAGGGFAADRAAVRMGALRNGPNFPAFMDCAYVDAEPFNYNSDYPAESPPDLRGEHLRPDSPDHWRFLLARHGRGINFAMADGSARWVRLEETYTLAWNGAWRKYLLKLPAN